MRRVAGLLVPDKEYYEGFERYTREDDDTLYCPCGEIFVWSGFSDLLPSPHQKKAGKKAVKRKKPDRREGVEECLLHVYWSGFRYNEPKMHHVTQRGRVSADLGLDKIPEPPFTDKEMQEIMFVAKMQAIKCLMARKKRKKPA